LKIGSIARFFQMKILVYLLQEAVLAAALMQQLFY